MLTVAIPKRNKLQNIIVLTPKDGGYERLFLKKGSFQNNPGADGRLQKRGC